MSRSRLITVNCANPMDSPPKIFESALLTVRRKRAQFQGAENFLLTHAAEDLGERLQAVKRTFGRVLDLATPGDAITEIVSASNQSGEIFVAEPLPQTRLTNHRRIAASEEALPFAEASFDLIVSAMALQWTNDLPGALLQIRRALKPDGLFLAVLPGGETLTELRQSFAEAETQIAHGLSPRVSPFIEIRTMGSLLQRAGFALPVTDIDRLTVRYANMFELLRDLRRMGATNILTERSRKPLQRAVLVRASEIYTERFSDADGRIRATFDLLWISGWAPSDSQQKPLRPGSAKTRLADALGTTEKSTGEKPGGN
jgi:SAM-dependent methyltransferase